MNRVIVELIALLTRAVRGGDATILDTTKKARCYDSLKVVACDAIVGVSYVVCIGRS